METTIEKEPFIKEKHLTYLDGLRKSGDLNMFGARPYINAEFPDLSKEQAGQVLQYWMRTFSQRNP